MKPEKKEYKKPAVRVLNLRQRLRLQSAEKLDKIANDVRLLVAEEVLAAETEINSYDVMRLICNSQTKSIRTKLISELTNETERRLELFFNKQQNLGLGDSNAGE